MKDGQNWRVRGIPKKSPCTAAEGPANWSAKACKGLQKACKQLVQILICTRGIQAKPYVSDSSGEKNTPQDREITAYLISQKKKPESIPHFG
eukprot:s3140_g5.t1